MTTAVDTFDLEEFAKKLTEETGESDPGKLAHIATERVFNTPQSYDALLQAMRVFFRHSLVKQRRDSESSFNDDAEPQQYAKRTGNPAGSQTLNNEIRSKYSHHMLEKPYYGQDGWKKLGEFTFGDLRFAIKKRRQNAANLMNTADTMAELDGGQDANEHITSVPEGQLHGVLDKLSPYTES